MPVTKTAKRALRSSKKKEALNKITLSRLSGAIRLAKKDRSTKTVETAISFADRAAKKKIIHSNKASRIKHALSLFLETASKPKSSPARKTT